MSLLVFGTVALDNVKTPCGMRKGMLGGSASHFSMSASLFTEVHLAGVVGTDFPAKYIELFKRKKVDISSLVAAEGRTFCWGGEYKRGDFNNAITLATELGVLDGCTPRLTDAQKKMKHVFLANFDPDVQMQLLELMQKPKFVGLDSMNLWIDIKKKSLLKLAKKVDMFVVNDGEARALTQETNLVKAAKHLRRLGPELIVVKKGEHGVLFYCDKFMFSFPAYPIEKVVDPTGAGDTFAGGIMGYLSKCNKVNEKTLKQALVYATTLSSFNVEGFGVEKTSKLTMPEVNRRMRKFVKFIRP